MGPAAFRRAGPPWFLDVSRRWASARSELVPPYDEHALALASFNASTLFKTEWASFRVLPCAQIHPPVRATTVDTNVLSNHLVERSVAGIKGTPLCSWWESAFAVGNRPWSFRWAISRDGKVGGSILRANAGDGKSGLALGIVLLVRCRNITALNLRHVLRLSWPPENQVGREKRQWQDEE